MQKYKALITDLDGSAVAIASNGGEVTELTRKAIQYAQEDGRIVACATGRGWEVAEPVVRALGLHHPCVVEGGTRIIDPVTEETLWEKAMSNSSAEYVFEMFHEYTPDGFMLDSQTDRKTDDLENINKQHKILLVKDTDKVPSNVRYMYVLGVASERAIALINAVNTHSDVVAHMTPSWYGEDLFDVHVTHKEATKEHAIAKWRDLLGLKKDETIGFGDAGNDIPIFESVGLKIAAKTATQDLLALADHIAPGPKEQGLEYIIEKFLMT